MLLRSSHRLWSLALSKSLTATRTLSSLTSTSDNVLSIKLPSEGKDQVMFKIDEAVSDILATKANFSRKFDQTLDVAIKLNIDPRKPNQSVRGIVKLPHGTGKKVRVAVFARGNKIDEALAAGAHVVGAEDLLKDIQDGKLDFDKCIATPDMMPLVGRVARILGPRGLMPNPKLGTVTMDVKAALEDVQGGQVEFRAEKNGIVHAGVGKISFTEQQLLDNIRAFMIALGDAKPSGAKGKYMLHAHVSPTMGKGYPLELSYVDPTSVKFMRFDV